MAKKKLNLKDYVKRDGNVEIQIQFSKFNERFENAQFELDTRVMTDMLPLMPMAGTGNFKDRTQAQSMAMAGSGIVCAAAPPFGRFLYYGKVMVDPVTGSPWARKDAKKVVTERPLTYSNKEAKAEWFEVAKEQHKKEWIVLVEKKIGGK